MTTTQLNNNYVKDLYDKSVIASKYDNEYEFNRWFINPSRYYDYLMTREAILLCLDQSKFENCLELGPGPGTWTKYLYRANPSANFHLVDISEEMKTQFELEMRQLPNITYDRVDFLEHSFSSQYNLFFSSRAIEYIDDKNKFFEQLTSVMTSGAKGIIITKNPNNGRKKRKLQHTRQISVDEMKRLLIKYGFTKIQFHPVIIRIPILSRFAPNLVYKMRTLFKNTNSNLIESYIVTFIK